MTLLHVFLSNKIEFKVNSTSKDQFFVTLILKIIDTNLHLGNLQQQNTFRWITISKFVHFEELERLTSSKNKNLVQRTASTLNTGIKDSPSIAEIKSFLDRVFWVVRLQKECHF